MRRYLVLLVVVILAFVAVPAMQPGRLSKGSPPPVQKKGGDVIEMRSHIPGVKLHRCYHEGLGAYYACDFSWPQREGRDVIAARISEDPLVEMQVIRVGQEALSVRQLSRDWLAALGRYADGFVVEETKVAGEEAIKVKAFAADNPDKRLADYYFVRRRRLYSLMLSVVPKGAWGEYQFLFEDIVRNFEFK